MPSSGQINTQVHDHVLPRSISNTCKFWPWTSIQHCFSKNESSCVLQMCSVRKKIVLPAGTHKKKKRRDIGQFYFCHNTNIIMFLIDPAKRHLLHFKYDNNDVKYENRHLRKGQLLALSIKWKWNTLRGPQIFNTPVRAYLQYSHRNFVNYLTTAHRIILCVHQVAYPHAAFNRKAWHNGGIPLQSFQSLR